MSAVPRYFSRSWGVPNPLQSQEQADRFEHRDLVALSDFRLWQERRQAVRALETIDERNESARDWWIERLRQIEAEQRTRTT